MDVLNWLAALLSLWKQGFCTWDSAHGPDVGPVSGTGSTRRGAAGAERVGSREWSEEPSRSGSGRGSWNEAPHEEDHEGSGVLHVFRRQCALGVIQTPHLTGRRAGVWTPFCFALVSHRAILPPSYPAPRVPCRKASLVSKR